MGSYYYLVAQLPYLIFGQTAPMSSEAFKELAVPFLNIQDAALLKQLSLDSGSLAQSSAPASGSEFIDNWREWERVRRLNLAKHRFIRTKREGTAPAEPPATPADAVTAAAKAVAEMESPIEVELVIDKSRWNAIESLQGNDYFGRNTIFAYLLKLLILERRASFHAEIGFSEYKSLYAAIIENAQAGVLAAGESK